MNTNIKGTEIENPFLASMQGIGEKIALQEIRKVVRDGNTNDTRKLFLIRAIVHSFEESQQKGEENAAT